MSKKAQRYRKGGHVNDNRDFRRIDPFGHGPAFFGEGEQKVRASKEPLEPQTENQGRYLASIKSNDITLGLGPAGTGKTFVATAWAAEQLLEDRKKKLIITRPAVEADGEGLGFLPGDMGEKFDPYFRPVKNILVQRLGEGQVEGMLDSGRIEVAPIGFLRGWTFENCIVILDEAQNTTPSIMKMFLTRIGKNCTMIVNGDIRQSDIKGPNGLWDAKNKLDGLKGIGQITFTRDDIVRHGLVREIIDRYECEADDHGAFGEGNTPDFLARP